MNDKLYIGKINSYFGLKGEVKVLSDTNHKDKIFKEGNKVYIDNERYEISSSKLNNKIIIGFLGYDSIDKINDLIGKDIYITRKESALQENDYLYIELLNMGVYEKKTFLGTVKEILVGKNISYIKLKENLIIPLIAKYLIKVDLIEKKVYVKNSKELII